MRTTLLLVFAVLGIVLTGCPVPLAQHPLSDETSSKIDERLLGKWEIDVRPLHDKFGNDEGEPTATYLIERAEGKTNSLVTRYLTDGEPKGEIQPLHTTHLAMHDFLSLGGFGGSETKVFSVCMYTFDDADHAKLYVMDTDYVVEQIDGGHLPGKVERNDGRAQSILISADGDALRAFVHRAGTKAFDMEHPLACKRIKPSVAED